MSKERVKIYDATNIDTLVFPTTKEGSKARDFLLPLIKNGVHRYIKNIDVEMRILTIDDLILPVTINQNYYGQSYTCSPYGHYVECGMSALSNVDSLWLRTPGRALLGFLGMFLKLGKLNQVVIVNNWLFSTDLFPAISEKQIEAISVFLNKRFPKHAIVFRSIHTYHGNHLYKAFKNNAFNLIASRLVYFLNTEKEEIFKSRIFKSDFKLLRETDYTVENVSNVTEEEIQRILELYTSIYCEKHSALNPQFTSDFIKLAIESNLLQLKVLRKQEDISAVVGYWEREGIMLSPLLGYDTKKQPQDNLYRLSSTVLTQEARDQKCLFHLSSGASFYKKIRKAETSMEYCAVYHKHLPFYRRLPWKLLQSLINGVGRPFFHYYQR